MESIKYTVKLDLTDNGTINTGWRIKQGDFRNIILIVKVVNNNEVYFSAENIPSILFHRPDGKTVIGKMDAYANDCYAYSIIGNELAVAGPVVMDVKFNDNGRISTASCVFECVVDTIDGTATPADIYPGITLEEVQEKATVVATDVATEVATIVAEEIAKEYASSGITLTSASPLESSAAAGIAGLSAKGNSTQAEGTPTPTNPIAIVDASGVVEARTKNLFDIEKGTIPNASKARVEGGKIIFTNDNYSGYRTKTLDAKIGDELTWSFDLVITSGSAFVGGGGIVGNGKTFLTSGRYTITFIYDGTEVAFCGRSDTSSGYFENVMLEYGTSASLYVAYASNEINLSSIGIDLRSIPNTNIADTLTIKPDGSGEWVQKVDIVDLSALNWSKTANYWYSEDIAAIAKKRPIGSVVADIVCSTLTPAPSNQIASVGLGTDKIDIYYNNGNVIATPTESPTGILYFELATPIVHQLTAEQVAAILALQTYAGTTIVDSELDDVVVDYVGDTKGYIDSKFEYLYELIRSYHPEAQMMSLEDEPTAEEEEGENV